MSKKLQSIRGFRDLDEKACEKIFYIYKHFRELALKYNCYEIKTPTLEQTNLFIRSVGEGTDIVDKEIFNFEYENQNLCLKPEATASIVRFMINRGVFSGRFFTFCSLFRKERPQKGRYREFFTFSIEFFGRKDILQSIECLDLCIEFFSSLNIPFKLKINNIGSLEDRKKYVAILQEFLKENFNKLSETSQNRFNAKKFLRILDSKEDQEILKSAPKLLEHVNESSLENFIKIQNFLKYKNISFEVDKNLVRGLDYYNDLVFEIIDINHQGQQNSICGGGNYDGLFETLNSQPTSAMGFGIGIDRILDYINLNSSKKKIALICNLEKNYEEIKILRNKYIVEILENNQKLIQKAKRNFDLIIIEKDEGFSVNETTINKNYTVCKLSEVEFKD